MTFIHMDALTAASAVELEVVELQTVFCNAFHVTNASASIRTRSVGDVTCTRNGAVNVIFNWIDPTSSAPGSPVFEVKRGASNNDEPSGPAAGVWTPVTSNPTWGLSCSTTFFGPIIRLDAAFTVSIRQGNGPVIDTATWSLDIECGTLN